MDIRSYILTMITWLLVLCGLYLIGYYIGLINVFPNAENLVAWDADFYNSIRLNGYQYVHKEGCNAGFFPLLAAFWYLMGDGGAYISGFNLLIFLLGLYFLVKAFNPNKWQLLITLSLPPMMFFYVPYSESLFFFFASFLLIGLKKNKNWLVASAIFFASLARPSFLFFVPAFIFLFLIEYESSKRNALLKKYSLYYALPTLLALAFLVGFQYIQTETWFAYFKAQHHAWSRHFRIPNLPYGTLEGRALLWIEAISFWMGIILWFLGGKLMYTYIKNRQLLKKKNQLLVFCIVYLLMSFFSIAFFNPSWVIHRTLLNGINRYLFVNPFMFVFLWKMTSNYEIKTKHLKWLFPFSFIIWLLVDFYYLDIWGVPYFLVITTYLFAMLYYFKNQNKFLFYLLFFLNCIGQLYLFHRFINDLWVG